MVAFASEQSVLSSCMVVIDKGKCLPEEHFEGDNKQ